MIEARTTKLLSNIQANIVKPHGRTHCWYIFFHIPEEQKKEGYLPIRKAISDFSCQITSGLEQVNDAIHRDEFGREGKMVCSLFISKSGHDKIISNREESKIPHMAEMTKLTHELKKATFSEDWANHVRYEEDKIDLVIMIADDHYSVIKSYRDFIISYFTQEPEAHKKSSLSTQKIKYLFTEKGKARKIGDAYYEPFGYKDGLTKIPFWKEKNKALDFEKLALVLDEQAGSFISFLKIEQDVDNFHQQVERITRAVYYPNTPDIPAESLLGFKENKEKIYATIMGRFRDGTPLIFVREPIMDKIEENVLLKKYIREFDEYDLGEPEEGGYMKYDPHGKRCPFFAHIRRANPRDQTTQVSNNWSQHSHAKDSSDIVSQNKIKAKRIATTKEDHASYCPGKELRIVRRGIPYGSKGEKKQGLLFVSYQSSICQFITVINWMRATKSPAGAGKDPIFGIIPGPDDKGAFTYKWKKNWESNDCVSASMNTYEYITLRGCEYFYAPSIEWLQSLVF